MEGPELFFTILFTSAGLLAFTYCSFKYFLEGILKKIQRKPEEKHSHQYQLTRNINSEEEFLIGEEYESADHDVVAVVLSTTTSCIGIAAFLQERKIQYFTEKFPTCCQKDINGEKSKAETKTVFSALYSWAFDITRADSLNLLVDNMEFSQLDGTEDTLMAKRVRQYEEQYVFKLTCHFIHNYICDVSAHHELWEELVESGQKLLKLQESRPEDLENNEGIDTGFVWDQIWDDFPCSEWERTRIRFKSEHFHQWPHAGEMSDETSKAKESIPNTEPLVDI